MVKEPRQFAVLIGVGAATVSAVFCLLPGRGDPVVQVEQFQRHEGKYGYPTDPFAFHHGYVRGECCGAWTRWTMEYLSPDRKQRIERTGEEFKADADVPAEFRVHPAAYDRSGMDKGHMAPAGDMHTETAMDESFMLSNAMPQMPALNRGPWHELESYLRRRASGNKAEVWVCTGPAFVPDFDGLLHIKVIGSARTGTVWVPTHCWKTAIIKPPDGPIECLAWLAENTGSAGKYDTWAVSVDELERIVGLDFWRSLPNEDEHEAALPEKEAT